MGVFLPASVCDESSVGFGNTLVCRAAHARRRREPPDRRVPQILDISGPFLIETPGSEFGFSVVAEIFGGEEAGRVAIEWRN